MKQLALLIFTMLFSFSVLATDESKEKPTQHLKVADVKSMKVAKEIFLDKTVEIRNKKILNLEEVLQIHVTTYSLEKSVAFFAANLKGEKQELAKEIAVVVEDIHLASENNRLEKLKKHLKKYFDLVDKFIFCF
ncbi:MAG: hypothetical protein OQL06_10435 [Gammaproteobacteria bacterium]|nr:hypothetical protein [Gammaproteobacteria bacterium]